MKSLILTLAIVFGTPAYAQEAAQIMAKVKADYGERFNQNGVFIDDPALTARFSASQNAAISRLRTNGNLKKSVRITNNVRPGLVITVGLIQETSGEFVGLLIERSQYTNANEEGTLRLLDIPVLRSGRSLFNYNGISLVTIKSEQLGRTQGGRISIRYPTNVKANTFANATFQILKTTAGDLGFFTTGRAGFSQVQVQVWVDLLAQNLGVERVTFK